MDTEERITVYRDHENIYIAVKGFGQTVETALTPAHAAIIADKILKGICEVSAYCPDTKKEKVKI